MFKRFLVCVTDICRCKRLKQTYEVADLRNRFSVPVQSNTCLSCVLSNRNVRNAFFHLLDGTIAGVVCDRPIWGGFFLARNEKSKLPRRLFYLKSLV